MMLPDHTDVGNYANRRVTVMGLGSFGGGIGAVRFLAERGARITVTDTRPPEKLAESLAELDDVAVETWRLGEHRTDDFLSADLVVVNPAVKRDHSMLEMCRQQRVPLTSEMNLFWQHCRGRMLAVTGSNGKSTTTAMLHGILQATGWRCWLGGNVGVSLLPRVDEIAPDDKVVLELSSFQLADLDRLHVSPHVAVVTNFSPNHLDWHLDLEDYRAAKQTILRWQTASDYAVLNAEDVDVAAWPTVGRRRTFSSAGVDPQLASILGRTNLAEWVPLPGRHNLANAHAAATAAACVGADAVSIEQGMRSFRALPHRLERVAGGAGRTFYNDSLATTPESALVALDAFSNPIVLIAGGYDKQADLVAFGTAIARRAKAVALIGTTAENLRRVIRDEPAATAIVSPPLENFAMAFAWAVQQSSPGDIILLSPGCASYDWFRNFADRGTQFSALAKAWCERSAAD